MQPQFPITPEAAGAPLAQPHALADWRMGVRPQPAAPQQPSQNEVEIRPWTIGRGEHSEPAYLAYMRQWVGPSFGRAAGAG